MMNSTTVYKKITLLIIFLIGYCGFSQEKTVFPATTLTSNIGTDNTALRFVTSELANDDLKYLNPMTYVALQIQQETGAQESWYTYAMELEITPLLADGQPDVDKVYTITLQVENNTLANAGGSFADLSKHTIKEVYGAWVRIINTRLKDVATNTPELVNANVPNALGMIIGFSGQKVTRIASQSQPTIASNTYNENRNELVLSWGAVPGALSYDVEWTWLDSYGDDGATLEDTEIALTEKNFKQNNTRIQTTNTTYTIPLLYSKGFVVYRVRGVGRFFDTPDRYKYSRWSSGINLKEKVSDWSDYHEITTEKGHQNSKNWQFQASYAEEGKKKEVVSYFDGSLRNRQTVTKINSDDNVIVGEVIYDAQGRPAVEVLPVPTAKDTIGYYKDFNRNADNAIYHYSDFDLDEQIAKDQVLTGSMSSETIGASKYYSSNNDIASAYKARIADAGGMPFSQIEYTPDNTGRIQRKGGVGPDHQLGTKHEMRYAYGTPKQKELNRLFGYNVGNEFHYKKNVVIDPNGQSSISFLDPQGRTIATALAGGSPPQLTPLDDEKDNTLHKELSFNLLENPAKNRPYSSNAYGPFVDGKLYTSQEVVAADNTDYFFEYALNTNQQNFTDECITDADGFQYTYDLEIAVIDDTGTSRLSKSVDTIVLANGGSSFGLNDSILKLPAGSFGITKLLKVNKEALDGYAADYIDKISDPNNAACFIDPNGFAPDALLDGCFVSCEDCKQGLLRDANGIPQTPTIAKQNYVTAKMSTYEQFTDSDEETLLRARFQREWELLFLACDEPCRLDGEGTDPEILKNSLSCNVGVNKLLDDMRPTGQYGMQFTTDTEEDQNYDTLESLSIFKENNLLFSANENSWRNPIHYEFDLTSDTGHYYEEDGTISYIEVQETEEGYDPPIVSNFDLELEPSEREGYYKIEPQYLEIENIKDLKKYWKDSWAASLLTYHPEYSYLEYALASCVVTSSVGGASMNSDGFDNAINAIGTYADATNSAAPFKPLAAATTLVDNDPYFNNTIGLETTAMANARKAIMRHALVTNYDDFNKNMISVAYGNGTCSSISACTGNFSVSSIASLTLASDRDRVWQTYRSYYLGLKQKIQHVFATIYANNAGYNNYCIGSSDVPVALVAILADYPQASQVNGFLSTPSKTLCNASGNSLLEAKEKRFQPADNLYNSGQDTADGVDELFIQTNYDYLEETGVCPLARDMQFFLDGLVTEKNDFGGFISLRSNRTYKGQYLTRALFEELGGSFPEENLQISGTVTNETLEISFPNGSPIQLFAVPGYSWSSYGSQWRFTEISELVYNDQYNATTKSFGFEILGRVVPTSNPDNTFIEVVVTGSTLARIGECSINNSGNPIGQDLGDGSAGTLALNDDCDIKPRFKAAMIHLINNLIQDGTLNDANYELGGYAPYFESYLPEYFEIPPSSSVFWSFQNGSYTLETPSKVYMTYTPDEALPTGSNYIVTGFHIGRIINDTAGIFNIGNLTYLDSDFDKVVAKGRVIETGRTLLNFSCCGVVDVG